uniref:Uncharacterized protein n=1 Tax=Anguilla anguilla TaxID=7936 RepID=A0A0E9P906_ANGAN
MPPICAFVFTMRVICIKRTERIVGVNRVLKG